MKRRHMLAASLLSAAAMKGSAPTSSLPDTALRTSDPDRYWKRIRDEQFLLADWRAFLNNGSLGVCPRPVLKAVTEFLQDAAGLVTDEYPRWGYETLDEERATAAAFLGCKKDELAFTHNATEALSMIADGLDLKSGDEVLMTNWEHPSGKAPWHRRQQRDGIAVREVDIPIPAKSATQLADLMISAIGPKTRVLSFSGILSSPGLIMPVREICTAARAKGVITVVDGAHMNGQIPVNLTDLNCDYYAGSPHKWMFAPAGCGILYIREENLDRLWPTIVTGDFDRKELKAARFMKVGTNNRATIVGLMAGLKFINELGAENIYRRVHEMAKRNVAMARQRPYLDVLSSDDDRLYGALVYIGFQKRDQKKVGELIRKKRIWVHVDNAVRISTHIHTRPQDLDLYYATLDEAFGHRA